MVVELSAEEQEWLPKIAGESGLPPQAWVEAVVHDALRRAITTYRIWHPAPKPPKRPVGRPRMTQAEKVGRRSLNFFEDLWAFWRTHLGSKWEASAGPLYRQWQRHVEQQDWAWLARFREAQPWQQLQGRMAGRVWDDPQSRQDAPGDTI